MPAESAKKAQSKPKPAQSAKKTPKQPTTQPEQPVSTATTTPPVVEPVLQTENDETPLNNRDAPLRSYKKQHVWLDLQSPPLDLGRIVIELYPDCPLAAENFRALCTGEVTDPATGEPLTYAGSLVDFISPDYVVMGEINDTADERDVTELDSQNTGGDADEPLLGSPDEPSAASPLNIQHDPTSPAYSIYGGFFPDEEPGLERKHQHVGTVSMFSEKSGLNGSKFLITLKSHMRWLDGQYTVIGRVIQGLKSVHALVPYGENDETCVISACGRMKKHGTQKVNPLIERAQQIVGQAASEPATDKTPVICPHCQGTRNKYNCRQLNRGVKYRCKNPECLQSFWVSDHLPADVVEKALEIKKQVARDRSEAIAKSKAAAKSKTATDQAELPDIPANARLAGPHLAEEVQEALVQVVLRQQEKKRNFLLGQEDHKEYLEKKRNAQRGYDDDDDMSLIEDKPGEDDYVAKQKPVKGGKRRLDKKQNKHNNDEEPSFEPVAKKQRTISNLPQGAKPPADAPVTKNVRKQPHLTNKKAAQLLHQKNSQPAKSKSATAGTKVRWRQRSDLPEGVMSREQRRAAARAAAPTNP